MNKKILFLGAGGIGVSALTIAAKKLGAEVSGYDSNPNKITAKLQQLGIEIYTSPSKVNVENFDLIVYSSAILDNHPLLSNARRLNIKCLQRAMFLAELMKNFNNSIAVTGTHGKTTTSSILATLLCKLENSSSFVVGGIVKHTNSNIQINGSDKLVIEADESDASFLYLNPQTAIVTNIDLDHMTTYQNSYQNLLSNFANFINKDSINKVYICIDDKGCRDLLDKYNLTNKITSYGFSSDADIQVYDYNVIRETTNFKVKYKNDILNFNIKLPGKYNVLNATACIIACLDLGFKYIDIKKSLSTINGVARRFDIYNKIILGHKVTVIDDYGHHPTEIINSINAIRDRYPNKKLIHIFQPHRYTRNRDLIKEWPKALTLADKLILLPTYPAGESVINGAESKDIAKDLSQCILADSFDHAIYFLEKIVDNNTVVLIQGAGDVTNLVRMLGE
ncbi:MAG: UDP-N-acetylmuramate--L-alanine ligase [Francisella sp.]